MKNLSHIFMLILLLMNASSTHAASLMTVYHEALASDPTFQAGIAERFATREGLPISIASLLPSANFNFTPGVTRSGFSGSNYDVDGVSGMPLSPRNTTNRNYTITLSIAQTVFNAQQFANVAKSTSLAKSADANLNALLQDLMARTARAYFAVLNDEDNLRYSLAAKKAYYQQYDQINQQFKVGIKTITEVYTARAAYESSKANYIAAETALKNDKENLRVITGYYHDHLAALSEQFPLLTPSPNNIDDWVNTAQAQNWSIKNAQYNVDTARYTVREQFAGHLPTVTVQGQLDRQYTNNVNGYNSLVQRNGPGTQTDRVLSLNLNLPIFSGGAVIAKTNQAAYEYQVAQQKLEQTSRNTLNLTRQSYLGVIAGISQINADRESVRSNQSALSGMEAGYKVGTETLVDVLNQRQKLFQAETQYAKDRYNYVNQLIALKQAAGTLSDKDLAAIDEWLTEKNNNLLKNQFNYK